MSANAPRIVSLLPAATETICAAGLGAQLVGVSHACNWPGEVELLPRLTRSRIDSTADSAMIDAEVKSLTAAGKPLYEIDGARLEALRPTLIVTQSQCDVCAVSESDVRRLVAERPPLAATNVLTLNPRSLDEVLQDVERIGVAASGVESSRACAAALRARVSAVERMVSRSGRERRRVVVIEWVEPLMVAGNWTPELVRRAGGRYDLAAAGAPSPYVPWREIVAYGPELLVVAPCGFDLERSRREAQRLEDLTGWADLPAVARNRVHVVDGDAHFNRPGPSLVDTLERLAAWLNA